MEKESSYYRFMEFLSEKDDRKAEEMQKRMMEDLVEERKAFDERDNDG